MTVSNTDQLMTLLYGVLAGAVCGALACVLNAFRNELKLGKFLSTAADLLFWLLSGVIVVAVNFSFGDGSVRVYQIFAAVGGLLLYALCLGRLTEKAASLILRGIKLVLYPAVFLLRGIRLYIGAIAQRLAGLRGIVQRARARIDSVGKVRKKIRKKYKKML